MYHLNTCSQHLITHVHKNDNQYFTLGTNCLTKKHFFIKCTFSVFRKRSFSLSIIKFSWHLQLAYVTHFIFKTEEVYRKVRHISLPATTVSNKSLKFFGRQLWNEFRTSSYEFYNECFNFVYMCHQSSLLVAWGMKYRRKKTRFDSDCRGSP